MHHEESVHVILIGLDDSRVELVQKLDRLAEHSREVTKNFAFYDVFLLEEVAQQFFVDFPA